MKQFVKHNSGEEAICYVLNMLSLKYARHLSRIANKQLDMEVWNSRRMLEYTAT